MKRTSQRNRRQRRALTFTVRAPREPVSEVLKRLAYISLVEYADHRRVVIGGFWHRF